ncbi:hypothetical protein GCM10010967_53210 [Dyadobacter beijingensis]|uniref:Knr4/Smi1-like domain-containing protein n=1 Tax=Dyadobacter beijingensis TaxID=365489 RepID=A0ABQ2IKC9_9BACT|nr:SMI1/KNR4 family protein [Dyadobacter beijingensis]GGN10688.1 hypothetical protein GCM10010967_53210 [Dyadobacter beijingensis]
MKHIAELETKWRIEKVGHPPVATKVDIKIFQEKHNVILPSDLVEYFQSLNGTDGDCTDDLFEFYSIHKIQPVNDAYKDWKGIPNYQDLQDVKDVDDLYVFANTNFHLFAYAIRLNCLPSKKIEVYVICGDRYKKIADSFSEFITLYLSSSPKLQL